jgi:GGDEF domain-containing protein
VAPGCPLAGSLEVDPGQPPRPARRRGPPALPGVGHPAAPVLANLRNLAIAEIRAATDALTGLPNNWAVQDTIKRMVAQASRSV